MTIREALSNNPNIEIDLLLSHILGQPKEFLYLNPSSKLSNKQTNQLTNLIKRRLKGEPIAYILGYKYFFGLKFKVTKDTLIPRPETEWLVNETLKIIKNKKLEAGEKHLNVTRYKIRDTSYRILDMGTGTGCIAISIATALQPSPLKARGVGGVIVASDISPKALNIAKQNTKTHSTKIKFVKSDLFQNIKNKFDLIIANLPYVQVDDYKKLKSNLQYEPKTAITDGTNKNTLYQKFFKQVNNHLNPNATMLLEIDPIQKKSLPAVVKNYLPGAKITFHKDLNNLWRYVYIIAKTKEEC